MGVSPDTVLSGTYSISGGELVISNSTAYFPDLATQAWNDAMAVRDDAVPIPESIPEIGGLTFTAGTYRSDAQITIGNGKTVTFDGEGDYNSKFLIQSVTDVFVGAGCHVVLTNGAQAKNVVWAIGTEFTNTAGTDFKGSMLAGTSVTIGAETHYEGSIMALASVTFGAETILTNGCVVALDAMTFGTMNTIRYVQEVVEGPAPVIDLALPLANDNDEIVVACMPLTDTTPAACNDLLIKEAMEDMIDACTQQGIINAIDGTTRRASGIDIPQLKGRDISTAAATVLDEGGGTRTRSRMVLRKKTLYQLQCHTTNPSYLTIILCCYFLSSASSYCGSLKNNERRRRLPGTEDDPLTYSAAELEQYLPSITEECSSQFQALANTYLEADEEATCFANNSFDVVDLKCHAILVTGGVLQ
jgi:hypothetical protein